MDIAFGGHRKSSVFLPASIAEKINLNPKRHRLTAGVAAGRFTQEVFAQVLDYAKEALKGRNPAAVFIALLQKELGYRSSEAWPVIESPLT